MPSDSNRERVLNALRISTHPLDDDQLAAQAGVRPRQTVNQLCRQLERDGILRRYAGADGKIVNQLITAPTSEVQPHDGDLATVEQPSRHARPPASSTEQRAAERVMLDLLGKDLGLVLDPATIKVPSGERVEIDGTDTHRTVLVEC